jgi:hypothetical protein
VVNPEHGVFQLSQSAAALDEYAFRCAAIRASSVVAAVTGDTVTAIPKPITSEIIGKDFMRNS